MQCHKLLIMTPR